MVEKVKLQRVHRFASKVLIASRAEGFDASDLSRVMGFIAEVTSASNEGGDAEGGTSKIISDIQRHAEFYRMVRNGGETDESPAASGQSH